MGDKSRAMAILVVLVATMMPSNIACSYCPPPPRDGQGGNNGGGGHHHNGGGSHGGVPINPSSPYAKKYCPKDALKLGACVDVLGGLVHVVLGDKAVHACCPVVQGLLEIEAALCLCTALRAKVLNLDIYLPIALELLATCGKNVPKGFKCPPPIGYYD